MEDIGFWDTLVRDLTSGKGQFRLFVQPAMALILGIRTGITDARAGHAPFGRRLLAGAEPRSQLFKDSIKRAIIPLGLAFVLDMILQKLTLGRMRPLVAIIVAAILVWIPFSLVRGFTNRIWRRSHPPRKTASAH
jgi:hypothetical protein